MSDSQKINLLFLMLLIVKRHNYFNNKIHVISLSLYSPHAISKFPTISGFSPPPSSGLGTTGLAAVRRKL